MVGSMSEYAMNSVGVVYLSRGKDDDGLQAFKAFKQSYCHYTAEYNHQLYILAKGWEENEQMAVERRQR